MSHPKDAEPETSLPAAQSGETFKREGPEPPERSTGGSVEEMNEKAREAMLRNVRPPDTDDEDPDAR